MERAVGIGRMWGMWDSGYLLVLKGKKASGHTSSVCRDGGKKRQGNMRVSSKSMGE